jgi:hypothetical protein
MCPGISAGAFLRSGLKKAGNRKQSCFSCFHGRRIDTVNNFAVCFFGCKSDADVPELITEPNSGDCNGYENRDEEISGWTERYMGK